MAEGGWWGAEEGGGGLGGVESGNHIKFPCLIRHLHRESIDMCWISSGEV